MNDSLLRVWVWVKISALLLIALYVLLFVVNNAGEPVEPWLFFGVTPGMSLLVFALLTFLLGAVTTFLVGTVARTYRQIKGVKSRERTDRLEREVAEMRSRTAASTGPRA